MTTSPDLKSVHSEYLRPYLRELRLAAPVFFADLGRGAFMVDGSSASPDTNYLALAWLEESPRIRESWPELVRYLLTYDPRHQLVVAVSHVGSDTTTGLYKLSTGWDCSCGQTHRHTIACESA